MIIKSNSRESGFRINGSKKPFNIIFIIRYFFPGSEREQVAVDMVGAHVRRTAPEPLGPDRILFTELAFFSLHV
jgi:hypothetical protein